MNETHGSHFFPLLLTAGFAVILKVGEISSFQLQFQLKLSHIAGFYGLAVKLGIFEKTQ